MDIKSEVLKTYSKSEILGLTSVRKGEVKLGEVIENYVLGQDLKTYRAQGFQFIIVGIPESVGAMANGGRSGAENAWKAFLSFFLNVQHNRFMDASKILLLGHVQAASIQEQAIEIEKSDLAYNTKLRKLCERIDDRVHQVLVPVIEADLIPIVIGGGHNNAYPIIKACHQSLQKPVHVINCDPHADFRVLEGRHSGNGFSYAIDHDLLERYHVLGLHQNYNSDEMLTKMEANKKVSYTSLEDIEDWTEQVNKDLHTIKSAKSVLGIELDMDAIAQMPASAFTPSGISMEQARYYVKQAAKIKNVRWLHLPEAAPNTEHENRYVGKSLSYLVTDFIKHHG